MIIDLILDRKENITPEYKPKAFYNNVSQYGEIGYNITQALDAGTEQDIKNALNDYIRENDYNLNLIKYINSQNWL